MADKILVIDDDQDVTELIKQILAPKGYQTIIANRGRVGLQMAFDESPDLILLDVMIPDINGIQICRQIREGGLQMPILMLSARYKKSPDKVLGFSVGADDYLASPFDPEELLARIQALLRRRTPAKLYHSQDNPYIVGAPVPPDKFYGRQQMIGSIMTAIKARNHVVIYGERRIGKTSLLHRLAYLLKKETDTFFIPSFIQMQLLSEDDFFEALIDETLKHLPAPVKLVIPSLVRSTSSQTYKGLYLLQDLETIIQAWDEEYSRTIQLVFLLDEGDHLNEFSETTQMQLRGLLQNAFINQHVRLVWSGVSIDQTWQSNTSPWFNLFRSEFRLDSLSAENARRLILEPVEGIYLYEEAAIAKIQELSLNKPYLIQRLCCDCIDYIQEREGNQDCITLQDVETVWVSTQQRG